MNPHSHQAPYTDYMMLTFSKDGKFEEALNVFQVTDDSDIEDLSSVLTLRLKSSLAPAVMEEIYTKFIYKKEGFSKPEMLNDSITKIH